jgi:hypothetical protein
MKVLAHSADDGTVVITAPAFNDPELRGKILVTGAVYEDVAVMRAPTLDERDQWVRQYRTKPPKVVEGIERKLKQAPVYRDESDEEILQRLGAKLGAGYVIVENTDLPEREKPFRRAWRIVNRAVVIDLPTAKTLWIARFTDIAKREKSVLPPTIHDDVNRATTIDDLKRAWPPGLPRK